MKHDYSTLNLERIEKLPLYTKPPTYHIQDNPGNGCFLDPPGYPTYFTQSIYTQHGNNPRRGVQMILLGHVIEDVKDWIENDSWGTFHARKMILLHSLYKPLPLEHPRTQAWITTICKHFNHCYVDDSRVDDKIVIWPVPYYKLKTFKNDTRFSDEWRTKEKAAIEQANTEIIEATRKIAVYENHKAVRSIREFYPEFSTPVEEYENLPHVGNWWERHAVNFTPETCPGDIDMKHPVNGSWCQMCGWVKEQPKLAGLSPSNRRADKA